MKLELWVVTEYDSYWVEVDEKYYDYHLEGEFIPQTYYCPAELPTFELDFLQFPIYEHIDEDSVIVEITVEDIPEVAEYGREYEWQVKDGILFMGDSIETS